MRALGLGHEQERIKYFINIIYLVVVRRGRLSSIPSPDQVSYFWSDFYIGNNTGIKEQWKKEPYSHR